MLTIPLRLDEARLRQAIGAAAAWIADVAHVETDQLRGEMNSHRLRHSSWKGAIRGEYRAARREWDFFCPIWHGGQAVKALVAASRVTGEGRFLEAARSAADFIVRERLSDPGDPDHGLILAYEDVGDAVNTSAILESVGGLLDLDDATGDGRCRAAALDAVAWVARRAYKPGEGLFRDLYGVPERRWREPPWKDRCATDGRPLLDDGIFLRACRATGEERYRSIFYETAERLLREEQPPGNWVRITPANARTGAIHPRHAYWWGRPMVMAHRDSGEARYRACAERAGEWYLRAMRRDGGLLRNTYVDFSTDSFGHATSGIACAAIFWKDLYDLTGEERWLEPIERALGFCMRAQFTHAADPNLAGAVLEKVLPPDGTDASPYHLRDLATIFFVQAACAVLAS